MGSHLKNHMRRVSGGGFREQCRRLLRAVAARPETAPGAFRYRDIRFFIPFVRPVWRAGAAGIALTLLSSALGSLLPLGTKVFIDFVVMEGRSARLEHLLGSLGLDARLPEAYRLLQSVTVLVLAMLAIGVAVGLIGLARQYLTLRFQQELTFNLQTALFDHILRFPLAALKKRQSGYLVARVAGDVGALQHLFSGTLTQLITYVFYLLFGIVILFALSVKLTIVSLLLLPVYLAVNVFFAGRQKSVSLAEREKSALVHKEMQEIFSGVEVVKAHVTERREVSKVAARLRSVIETRIHSFVLSALSGNAVQAAQFGTTLLIMWFGAGEIRRGAMTIGDYVAFTTYVVYLSGSVRGLSLFHVMLQPLFASLERVLELFRMDPEMPGADEAAGERIDPIGGELRFEGVSFAYDNGDPVLRGIDLVIRPGETVALTGVSGAGKTTLVGLLLKFYRPGSGELYLDGRPYAALDTRWLRGAIGVVSQDVFLFGDTVERNIRYGRPGASLDEVRAAARRAGIHEEIEALPGGYATVIGERGASLSSGQRQRIALARAFLRNPAVLILDEPTSALDAVTEARLVSSLKELLRGRTAVIVSHRVAVTRLADRVIRLEAGQVAEL